MLDKTFTGIVTNYKIDKELLTIEVKGREKIRGNYYFKSIEDINSFNIKLGDTVLLKGEFKVPNSNTVPNLFNYKEYLYHKHIYMTMNIDSIEKIKSNTNIFYKIKNLIDKHISNYKSRSYLETFILGDKSLIDNDTYSSYQSNGISHLFSISGMHITILSTFILLFLSRLGINKNISLIVVSSFLLFYMFLTGLSASVVRSSLLFFLLSLNKIFKLELSTIKVLILTFIIILFFNIDIIYNIGFIYSFTISFFLIYFSNKLNNNSYIKNLFIISLISFIVSLPITLHNSYEVNFLSIILNLIFVPFVSIIVFPLGLITFFIPLLDNLFMLSTNILELLSNYFNNISLFKMIFGKINIYFIIGYYLIIFLLLKTNRKKYYMALILILILQYSNNYLFTEKYIIGLDVGQGDSTLVSINNKNILIDTGGKVEYKKENWMRKSKLITDTKTIPLLKSLGIRKLDYLIITHGDYDHMGEAINLVENYKVEKVVFNCGEFNDLEKKLISVLDRKKIKYYSCVDKIDNLYFLQTTIYDNENDNSNVIYTEIDNYKFMFMGDAGFEKEKDILDKYKIRDIDVLKVGHHGSKTSSSIEFINRMNPNYSIISVGKNNRYGHPNKEVVDNLKNSNIYRTDEDGSIMFKIKNSKLEIRTYEPV